jgi:outer membrane immunogenic protein
MTARRTFLAFIILDTLAFVAPANLLFGSIALLVVGTASAANAQNVDVVSPSEDWNGFLAGILLGGGFGTSRKDFSTGSSTGDFDTTGVIGGLSAGYDRQFGNIVAGLESDFSGSGVAGSKNCPNPAFICQTDSPWIATVRPRVGYALDRILPYVTAGLAVGDVHVHSVFTPKGTVGVDFDRTELGWTVGAGVAAALTSKWSVKAEYLYVQLADANGPVANAPAQTSSTKFRENVARVGLDYRF